MILYDQSLIFLLFILLILSLFNNYLTIRYYNEKLNSIDHPKKD